MPGALDFALGRGCRFLCADCGTFRQPYTEGQPCPHCGGAWPQGLLACRSCRDPINFRDPDASRDGPAGDLCGTCTRLYLRVYP